MYGLAGPVEIVLQSLTGQLLLRQQPAATAPPIDISRLAAGTYLLMVTTGDGQVLRRKVTKE